MTPEQITLLTAVGSVSAAVIISPLVQLYLGYRQTSVARIAAEAARTTATNAGRYEVAKFRQQWINTLRDLLAQQHSLLMTVEDYPFPKEEDRNLSALITKIELLLNPNEQESRNLIEVIYKLYDCHELGKRIEMDPLFVKAAQAVLKKEWDRVKRELVALAIPGDNEA